MIAYDLSEVTFLVKAFWFGYCKNTADIETEMYISIAPLPGSGIDQKLFGHCP